MKKGKAYWHPHPIAKMFPRMTAEEFTALKEDMVKRRERGMLPLEHPILLYMGMILDGRHRHDAWIELAAEGAAAGYFAANPPPFENVASERGTLAAWMRAKSLNMVHRNIPAEQKAAIFLKAVDTFPELKAVIEGIAEENARRKVEGQPLVAGDQRGNTNKQIGDLAGVGATTVKLVKKLKKNSPEEFDAVTQGRTSVKRALKTLGEKKKPAPKNYKPEDSKEETETPATDDPWDIEFKAFGFISPPTGKSSMDIQNDLNAGTLKVVWSGRVEEQDGTLVAVLTDPDAKEFKIENE